MSYLAQPTQKRPPKPQLHALFHSGTRLVLVVATVPSKRRGVFIWLAQVYCFLSNSLRYCMPASSVKTNQKQGPEGLVWCKVCLGRASWSRQRVRGLPTCNLQQVKVQSVPLRGGYGHSSRSIIIRHDRQVQYVHVR